MFWFDQRIRNNILTVNDANCFVCTIGYLRPFIR